MIVPPPTSPAPAAANAVGGAASGAVGRLLAGVGGKALNGAAMGAAGGAAEGAVGYGVSCVASEEGCSVSGAAKASAVGAVTGGVFGAAAGRFGRKSTAKQEPDGQPSSPGCRTGVPHSFTGLTGVLMANGTTKPISEVKVGDYVLTAEPGKKKKEKHKVKAVIVTKTDRDYVDVVVDTKSGPKTIQTTEHHQFYESTKDAWTQAADLKAGQKLQNDTGGPTVVIDTKAYTASRTTYDLSIDGLHTYYVLAGKTPVLVHNVNEGDLCNLTLGPNLKGQKAEGVTAERGDTVLAHEQRMINEFGDRNGCAACGAEKSGYKDGRHWTGDHNPPNKLSPNGPCTLYPHCKACSKQQGGIVRTLIKEYYDFPAWKPRQ
ncbi:Hint domain-containing protein [Streptomyces brevispora]|uniref:Hint domain-containing protein n=1 Tax=Streptomyces brevispora TaxID=887462 RepID=UPI0037207C0D